MLHSKLSLLESNQNKLAEAIGEFHPRIAV